MTVKRRFPNGAADHLAARRPLFSRARCLPQPNQNPAHIAGAAEGYRRAGQVRRLSAAARARGCAAEPRDAHALYPRVAAAGVAGAAGGGALGWRQQALGHARHTRLGAMEQLDRCAAAHAWWRAGRAGRARCGGGRGRCAELRIAEQADPAGLFPRHRRREYVALRKQSHAATRTAVLRICIRRLRRYLAQTADKARTAPQAHRTTYLNRKLRAAKLGRHLHRALRPAALDARRLWSNWARTRSIAGSSTARVKLEHDDARKWLWGSRWSRAMGLLRCRWTKGAMRRCARMRRCSCDATSNCTVCWASALCRSHRLTNDSALTHLMEKCALRCAVLDVSLEGSVVLELAEEAHDGSRVVEVFAVCILCQLVFDGRVAASHEGLCLRSSAIEYTPVVTALESALSWSTTFFRSSLSRTAAENATLAFVYS